ncbi:MAG: hypothetical protein U1F58_19185 [Burkholderiales bacterium]
MNTARLWLGRRWGSAQFAKLLERRAGIATDAGHGNGVDRIVPREGRDARGVSAGRVPALPPKSEAER